jgi:hypothetical protein
VSHETPNAGFDPLAASPREGDSMVKWPILAQLPWVGEPSLREEVVTSPVDILPFAESTPEPYSPPTFHESGTFAPQFRIVDPALPPGEEFATAEPLDRRLHRATPAGRPAAEPPHLSLHRFPTAPTVAAPAIEPQRPPVGESPAPRQHRRFDPPQPRYGEGLALHHPNESLAAQLYQWQAMRKPQTALIAMSLLLLTVGGLYLFTIGRPAAEPKEVAEPPAWEIQPLAPASGGANETLAAPLPANPTLDLSTGSSVDPTAKPAANDPPQPMTKKVGGDAEDPIAAWLNEQPQLPQLTASKDAAEFPSPVAKPAETTVEKPVLPAPVPVVTPQPATEPAPDQSITPTPTLPSLTLTSPYPTTPYPPFPASLALPPSNAWPAAVAETLGPAFGPPQPPR